MPLYEYGCKQCGKTVEMIQKFSDPPLLSCADCGGRLERLISAPAIHFKGAGWYITDYARKNNGAANNGSPAKEEKSAGKTESKPETPAPTSKKTAAD
jgi:putative FmdB family regulatory protein